MDGGLFDGIRYAYTAKPAQDANAGARRSAALPSPNGPTWTSPSRCQARRARWRHRALRRPLDTDAFSLTDAAEELSLGMAHKVEEKHHTERKFAPERARRVVHADEVVDAMQQSHEPDAHAKLVERPAKHLLARTMAPGSSSRSRTVT